MRKVTTRIAVVLGFAAALVAVSAEAVAASPAARGTCAAAIAAPPELPGEFILEDFVLFVDSEGTIWIKVFPQTPWQATPPSEFFSDFVQVAVLEQNTGATHTVVGFQTHDGVSETFSFVGQQPGPSIEGYIMNDGALLFKTGVMHLGNPVELNLHGGFLATPDGVFTNQAFDHVVDTVDIATSDDPIHFDDEFPVYDLTTGTPVEPPVVATTTPSTAPPESTTTTVRPTTQERPHHSTTSRGGETCWPCWGIVLLFVSFVVCVIFTKMKTFTWWTCWLPWFLVIFIWVPFLLAGLWWWRPSWWWVPLLAWGPLTLGYAYYWARNRSWWKPWHWYVVGGYLAACLVVSLVVKAPEWGLLFPLFWLPWVAFYLVFRGLRQPWWRPWMYGLFGAYVIWVFVWVAWLSPWWAWWLPIAFVAVAGWWFVAHGTAWREIIGPKWCWLIPFAMLPFYAWWIPLWEPWWCFIIALALTEALICSAFTHFKFESWWTWWLPIFLFIFVWIPFWFAGLWFFAPNWWGAALVPWFVFVLAGALWWAGRRSWWKPWMWFAVLGYLAAAATTALAVDGPEWGLLFPVFWLPLAGFYVWYRARRQPWWKPWMFGLFAAYAAWLFWWVGWLTPWWAWWFPIGFVAIAGWWFINTGHNVLTIRHKLCWILPWCASPWLGYMVALECLVVH